jgi:eukaryotic-like serine/threonine-protein kinase
MQEAFAETGNSGLTSAERTALLPHYEILEEIGRGGMGVVYRGRHCELDIPVAIKVCLDNAGVERFHREAKLLAKVQSPYVVRVRDFARLDANRTLFVMDWVAGGDLAKILHAAQGPLPEARVLPWMRQVTEGMRVAAEQRIIHRDLKPANILIDEHDKARISDFGLARSVFAIQLTQTEACMGTPHYMAPEQAEDARLVDTRADIYSFGATFYHVLTGHPPFDGNTLFSILFKHKTEPLISPQARNPSLSERTTECIERCLAKSPNERFPSFEAVLSSIDPTPSGVSPWNAEEDLYLAPYMERYRARREIYLSKDTRSAVKQPDVYEFPAKRRILIQYGNIVEQVVDAVVSSDDDKLTMGGGVSYSLAQAAGPDLAKEAQRFVPVRPGRVVVTTAGALPARFVFHAVTIGGVLENASTPSRDLITELMHSCFYQADTLNLKTLAFPLLGTGAGRLPTDVCLDTMFRFLAHKFLQGMTSVCEARIVLFDWTFLFDRSRRLGVRPEFL